MGRKGGGGGGVKVTVEAWGDGAGQGNALQGCGTDRAIVQKQELGDHGGNYEGVRDVLLSDYKDAHGEDGLECWGGRLAMPQS